MIDNDVESGVFFPVRLKLFSEGDKYNILLITPGWQLAEMLDTGGRIVPKSTLPRYEAAPDSMLAQVQERYP